MVHRSRDPDGPYSAELCRSPSETGSSWDCAPGKVRALRREANAAVRRQGAWREAHQCAPGRPQSCAAMIRRVFGARGLDGDAAVAVASCESGLDPSAVNPSGASGLFQQMGRYWPGRAQTYGVGGRSVFDGEANAIVSAGMVAGSGWSAWVCRP